MFLKQYLQKKNVSEGSLETFSKATSKVTLVKSKVTKVWIIVSIYSKIQIG